MDNGHLKCSTLLAAAAVTALASIAHAEIRYVDDDAPTGGDGLAWSTAHQFLQDALAEASGNPAINEIRVAQGTYKPDGDEANPAGTGDRDATFQLISGVALRGGYAGVGAPDPDERDIELYNTVLSGDLLGDDGPDFENIVENSKHVVTAAATDLTAVLDGFGVRSGRASLPIRQGGGLLVHNGGATVTSCTFVANQALTGGGMACLTGEVSVSGCLFAGNAAGGGAMQITEGSSAEISDSVFLGNTALGGSAGAIRIIESSDITLINCTFDSNSVPDPTAVGGALVVDSDGNPLLMNCTFINNTSGQRGGAVGFLQCNPTFVQCSFVGNSAETGGAVFIDSVNGEITMSECEFVGNVAFVSFGAVSIRSLNLTLTDSIFRENHRPVVFKLALPVEDDD